MRPLASRMSRLGTETAFEVLARAKALEAKGRDIVHLEIGEPDFTTPPAIVAAGVAALERGETHYTPSAGVIELREADHVLRAPGAPGRGRRCDLSRPGLSDLRVDDRLRRCARGAAAAAGAERLPARRGRAPSAR